MQSARTKRAEDGKERADLEKYRALGGWVEKPDDMQPALEGDVSADVVIAGAGFAGLSAALELAKQGAKVVVIEREFPGFGASGRNAGYVAGAMALEYDLMFKGISKERATQIVRYYDDAVGFVEDKLKEHDIDCEYVQSGWIRAGVHPAQEKRIRADMQVGVEHGHKSEFLDQAQMRARGIPPAFLFGEYTPIGGTLHPGKYVMGLRRAALRAGVKLYENTPLLSYTEGPVIQVKTPRGSVSAPVLMFATNAYTPQLGVLANKVVPLRISAIETEPLSKEQLASLGWPRREGIVTGHWSMESFRLTARNTIISTVKRIHYPYGSETPNVPAYDQYRELRTGLHERLPTLKDVALRHCWSGYISSAGNALPVVGTTGPNQNIYYTAGCSGHGLASQSMVGHMIAQQIHGTEPPLLTALRHDTPSLPPEPFRWCLINGVLTGANTLDDRVNRKVRDAAA
ncbi:FAD-binding oxidoreductase [Burkholderia sp. Ac-20353]|uniref:NAD(P)/FAD-dependent oxidoreductase n=1 Tax=Burkholderia sp. Ac-20353 TaxID=2703894 RepID=UPI001F120A3A|nr:FAD-binding oxidoreductase [Burkholderia sp. Ac-20353]MBN3786832.1 FAD-binding oxidoreductase [Burkholderia sp. Ac-20353]